MTNEPHQPDLSRRSFLQTAALGALAPSLVTRTRAAEIPSEVVLDHLIDAHVHVWTPDVERYPLVEGFAREKMVPRSFTPKELLVHCRPQKVDRIVLIQMIFYGFDNRYMLDAIAESPETFRGVAVIDDSKPGACDEMRRLARLGVRGFRLYADKRSAESWLESPSMQAMWACAADTGQAMCLLADPDSLPAVRQMCERYPDTKVVIDHFARIGMRGPADSEDVDNLLRLADFKHTFVKTSAFYALGKKQAPYLDLAPLIRRLRDVFGVERLMWASDCPYQVQEGHTYADSIALIRDRLDFLTASDKAWMLRGTAERVFFT
ncbi:MAG: amidohydrolase [Planctomycetota bacterium]|nr:amidohydrolase family protein [Planctomycetaceae bacterium]MDQ3331525.1 amidohydrolase [Planctomycetota bacterium]